MFTSLAAELGVELKSLKATGVADDLSMDSDLSELEDDDDDGNDLGEDSLL